VHPIASLLLAGGLAVALTFVGFSGVLPRTEVGLSAPDVPGTPPDTPPGTPPDTPPGTPPEIPDPPPDTPPEGPCATDGEPAGYACLEWYGSREWGPMGLSLADVSGDGVAEILVGNMYGFLTVVDGGTHAETANVTVDGSIRDVDAGDVDGDGFLEVAASYYRNDGERFGKVSIYEWRDGGLTHEWTSPHLGLFGDALEIGDLDADGTLEIVVGTGGEVENGLHVVSHDTAEGYRAVRTSSSPAGQLHLANVDADPALEILTTYYDGLRVVDGVTFGEEWSLLYPSEPRIVNSHGVTAGDIDGSGAPKIIVGAQLSWLVVDPVGRTIVAEIPRQSFGRAVSIADVDGDGSMEIVGIVHQDLECCRYYPPDRYHNATLLPDSGGYVEVFDGATLNREWRSRNLQLGDVDSLGGAAMAVAVRNVDGDSRLEIVVTTYRNLLLFDVSVGSEEANFP